MPANVDGMVREGVSAYRAGRKDEARALLMRAVEIDQYNEQAWLWLSAVVDSVDEQRTCLENVLTINPGNERARQGMDMLIQKASGAAKTAAPASADDELFNTSFTPPPAPPTANPFSAEPDEELPSSIEWEAAPPTATSSASSNQRVNEPSQAEYDDWVSNLNLGGAPASKNALPSDAEKLLSMPADDDEDEDIFDLQASLGIQADDSDDLFSSGPFGDAAAPMADLVAPASPPKSSPSSFSSRSSQSKSNPRGSDALLDELEDEPADDAAFEDEFDEEMEKVEASEFFRYIPKEIKATRLPGTRERTPALVVVGILVVLLLNAGAVAFLVMRLTSG